MKPQTLLLTSTIVFASCQSAIKNNNEPPKDSLPERTSDVILPVPKATDNPAVDKPEDLLGYWVGNFEPDIDRDSLNKKMVYYNEDAWDRTNKINVSIDSIEGNTIIGHSVDAGTSQAFKGLYNFHNNTYSIILKEPGTNKYDGTFNMTIEKNAPALTGNWQAFNKIDIPRRKFILKKVAFAYNPAQELEDYARFADWGKWVKNKVDPETEGWDKSYFTTTEDVIKYNASNRLLTEDEVANLKKGDLYILRNSIYARHGFSFKNRPLRAFFDRQEWYVPITLNIKSYYTVLEKKNIALLLRYEKTARSYYDTFGR
ncbi:MAG: YARHG domain-containing protein [Chitinophagaceae bacterium]